MILQTLPAMLHFLRNPNTLISHKVFADDGMWSSSTPHLSFLINKNNLGKFFHQNFSFLNSRKCYLREKNKSTPTQGWGGGGFIWFNTVGLEERLMSATLLAASLA